MLDNENNILINNSNEYPFGQLSINYKDIIQIGTNRYQSVKNYVYANLVSSPDFISILSNYGNINNLDSEYEHLRKKDINKFIKEAIYLGYEHKITGSMWIDFFTNYQKQKIVYVCNQKYIGCLTDDEKTGENLIGEFLMQKRKSYIFDKIQDSEKKEYDNNFFITYIAYKILTEDIKVINLSATTPKGIFANNRDNAEIKKIIEKYDIKKITQSLKNDINKWIKNPDIFFDDVKKIKNSTTKNEIFIPPSFRSNKMMIVLYIYCKYILKNESEYQDLEEKSYDKAIIEQFDDLSLVDKKDIAKNLYNIYKKNDDDFFPKELRDLVENIDLENISDDDTISEQQKESPTKQKIPIHINNLDRLFIYDDTLKNDDRTKIFSLQDTSRIFSVDSKYYPSISHYIFYYILFIRYKIRDSYQQILSEKGFSKLKTSNIFTLEDFKTIQQIQDIYLKIVADYEENIIKTTLKEIIDIKYNINSIYNTKLLISTNDKNLIWKTDKKLKSNMIGNIYVDLLDKKRFELSKIPLIYDYTLNTDKIDKILSDNIILQKWVIMRSKDICNTFKIFQNFYINLHFRDNFSNLYNEFYKNIKSKKNKEFESMFSDYENEQIHSNEPLDSKTNEKIFEYFKTTLLPKDFITQIIKCIYNCTPPEELPQEYKIPYWFVIKIQKINEFKNIDKNIIKQIWSHTLNVIYDLIKNVKVKESKINIGKILVHLHDNILTHTKKNCIKLYDNNNDYNCIYTAIINLLKNVCNFKDNFESTKNKFIGKKEIDIAVSIITSQNKIPPLLYKKIIKKPTLEPRSDDIKKSRLRWIRDKNGNFLIIDGKKEVQKKVEVEDYETDEEDIINEEDDEEIIINEEDDDSGNDEKDNEDDYGDEKEEDEKEEDEKEEDEYEEKDEEEYEYAEEDAHITLMSTESDHNTEEQVKKQLNGYNINDDNIKYLLSKIKYIYNYTKINEYIKINRINFFAMK